MIYLFRRKTAANWTSANPVLMAGELGLETDTGMFKFGDGSTTWTGRPYAGASVGVVPWGAITGTLSAQTDLQNALNAKQATLVSATNIKTINGSTILGSGDLVVSGSGAAWGSITGTLSSQTDLNAALGLKADTASLAAIATSGSASDLSAGTLPAARFDDTAHGSRAGGALHAAATGSVAGFMAAADKAKLDAISGTNTGDQTIALTGEVTGSGAGTFAATIAGNAVTNAKLADVASGTIKGRATAGTGDPEDLTAAQATALLDTFTSGAKGLVPASGGGTTNFLRADGTFAAPPGGGGGPGGSTGEVQYNNGGAFAGAADVEIEGGQLRLPAIATPAAPSAGGVKLFGFGNAPHPAFLGPADVAPLPLQMSVADGNFMMWSPATGTAVSVWGIPAVATNGTGTAAATDAGSRRDRMKRIEYLATTPSTSALVSWRFNSSQITVGGGNSWEGGFRGTMHSGPSTGVTNASHRFFMGVIDSFGGSDVNPSTLLKCAGIGYDDTDTEVQFMHNDASGTATKIPLGASFPKPNADRAFTYRLRLYSPPGPTQSLSYEVTYLETGAVATGTVTTDLPSTTNRLVPVIYASVGGVSSVVGIAVGAATFQTEPY